MTDGGTCAVKFDNDAGDASSLLLHAQMTVVTFPQSEPSYPEGGQFGICTGLNSYQYNVNFAVDFTVEIGT